MNDAWSAQDLASFSERGWSSASANLQISQLVSGATPVDILRPCVLGDGIDALDAVDRQDALDRAALSIASAGKCCRFVPASGAASRMFADLRQSLPEALEGRMQTHAHRFPFWTDSQREALTNMSPEERAGCAKRWMLDEEAGWSELPKGLIPFRRYADGTSRNFFEEHMREWRMWANDAPIHFTVPVGFEARISALWNEGVPVSLSTQRPETDTLALDSSTGKVARHPDGSLLFRPGGHGALLANLNEVAFSSPYVLIRNIDNVVAEPDMAHRNEEEAVLLGIASKLTEERNVLLQEARPHDAAWRARVKVWLSEFHGPSMSSDAIDLVAALDRPIRVAGMVKNEGAPGGGPFWVRYADGTCAPAIVESAELPPGALGSGTHFNPVDLVCSTHGPKGRPYDLFAFQDSSMVFTAEKDWQGLPIRILERPGLWNGSMAKWLTKFVEVPSTTFCPVKTVFDLLDRD